MGLSVSSIPIQVIRSEAPERAGHAVADRGTGDQVADQLLVAR